MESNIPSSNRLSLKTQLSFLALACSMAVAFIVFQAGLVTDPVSFLVWLTVLIVLGVSGYWVYGLMTKKFGRTTTIILLGLCALLGYFGYIQIVDILAWHRGLTSSFSGEISFLTNAAEPFTRML